MAYIGTSPQNGVRNRFVYAATQGQTAFTGADADSKTLAISDQLYTDVYQNGVKLKLTTDWTATATTVTLVNAASVSDVIEILSFDVFSVSDTVPASTGGTFNGGIGATTGTFSGAVSGTTGTFSGAISATSFTGSGGEPFVANVSDTGTNVTASSEASLTLRNTSDTNNNTASIQFKNSANTLVAKIGSQFVDAGDRTTDLFFATRANGGSLTERMRIDSSGNVGIGTTSPSYLMELSGDGGDDTVTLALTNAGSHPARLRLNSGHGNWSVGNSVSVTDALEFRDESAGSTRMFINPNGHINSGTTYTHGMSGTIRAMYVRSDGYFGYNASIRASKTNIKDISDASWLLKLEPKSFNYRVQNADGTYSDEATETLSYGLIAEEVEAVNPELCYYDEVDGTPELKGVGYSELITPILKLVQQQQATIEALEARITALEAE